MKFTICLDFDGVIHSYRSGWKGIDICEDPPVNGTAEAIVKLREHWVVKVFSSRCNDHKGIIAIVNYLKKHGIEVDEVCTSKPPAFVYVDDRAIQFNGDWEQAIMQIDNFQNWLKKDVK